ncbi:hypothetical protein BD408DRAFT_413710 [Parasitella parasitica]|nr:hypothetical protein BD408DRAFT_413710 [Parasitella parasitica]
MDFTIMPDKRKLATLVIRCDLEYNIWCLILLRVLFFIYHETGLVLPAVVCLF